jgi:hypothetical protein
LAENKTGEEPVSDDTKNESTDGPETNGPAESGPTFTPGPDPLAGVKKGASDVLAGMEGKTVSMKVYVGSIIGVIVLMLLARCGG